MSNNVVVDNLNMFMQLSATRTYCPLSLLDKDNETKCYFAIFYGVTPQQFLKTSHHEPLSRLYDAFDKCFFDFMML